MTLISKETLQADLHFLFDDYGNPVSDLARQVIDVVSGADEAYDVDKVVERLMNETINAPFEGMAYSVVPKIRTCDAIEIVRKGGVE